MTDISRRNALVAGGVAGSLAIAPAAASSDSGGNHPEEWVQEYSHIESIGDDREELAKYQPKFVSTATDRSQMTGIYGWYADIPEENTRVYYYWTRYSHQDSVIDIIPFVGEGFAADSHLRDHEPNLTFVDMDTGEVTEVLYTGYHHYAAKITSNIPLHENKVVGRDTHVTLNVVSPHHHYEIDRSRTGVLAENISSLGQIRSFLDAYPEWLDEGVFGSSHPPAIEDPLTVKERGHWWADGTIDKRLADIRLLLNLRDAGDRDELLRDD